MAYDNRRSNGDYGRKSYNRGGYGQKDLSLIHISEPTRRS